VISREGQNGGGETYGGGCGGEGDDEDGVIGGGVEEYSGRYHSGKVRKERDSAVLG